MDLNHYALVKKNKFEEILATIKEIMKYHYHLAVRRRFPDNYFLTESFPCQPKLHEVSELYRGSDFSLILRQQNHCLGLTVRWMPVII